MSAKIEVEQATDGSFYWRLVAANGETLATSETYTRKADAEDGVEAALVAFHEVVDSRVEG